MSASSLRTRPTWGSSGSVKLDDGRETRESKLLRAELERKVTALEKALAKRDAALLSSRDEAATANEKLLDKTQRLALLEQESSRNETKMRRDSERLQVLELRARELETKASLAETKARDAETQVTAAEASARGGAHRGTRLGVMRMPREAKRTLYVPAWKHPRAGALISPRRSTPGSNEASTLFARAVPTLGL